MSIVHEDIQTDCHHEEVREMKMGAKGLGVVVTCVVLAAGSSEPAAVGCPGWECPDCDGDVGSMWAYSDGTCGSVSISAEMTDGDCHKFHTYPPGAAICVEREHCTATVTRTWTDVGANVPLGFCLTSHGQTRCLQDAPDSGTGTGQDTRVLSPMLCGFDWWVSIRIPVQPPLCTWASIQIKCGTEECKTPGE